MWVFAGVLIQPQGGVPDESTPKLPIIDRLERDIHDLTLEHQTNCG